MLGAQLFLIERLAKVRSCTIIRVRQEIPAFESEISLAYRSMNRGVLTYSYLKGSQHFISEEYFVQPDLGMTHEVFILHVSPVPYDGCALIVDGGFLV